MAATKRRELAVLVALGADPRSLRRVFLLLGGLLGGLGAVGGGALGWAVAVAADRFRLFPLPQGLLLFDHLPFLVRPTDVSVVISVTLLLTLACAALGASRAVRVVPTEGLRG